MRKSLAILPAASVGTGIATVAFPDTSRASESRLVEQAYVPRYFHPAEWRFIHAAVDRLIPSNADGPGAVELDVPAFLDRQIEAPYGHGAFWYMQGPFEPNSEPTLGYQLRLTPRELYRTAIAEVDQWCVQKYGYEFAALDTSSQDAALHSLEKGDATLKGVPPMIFFSMLLANTKEGYFADPIYGGNKAMGSWKMIGFPGARADYIDWVDQYGKSYPLGPVSIDGEKGDL
nr:gluconate 2-dehydrogenase subunit 3 family protein [Caballeronia sp. SBC2]